MPRETFVYENEEPFIPGQGLLSQIKKSKFKKENIAIIGPVKKSRPYGENSYTNIGLSLFLNKLTQNNISFKKHYEDGHEELVYDVKTLVDECHKRTSKEGIPVILKVIVESGLLTEEETKMATDICLEAGADFIKTSTGKVSVGAEMNKIKVMYDTIKSQNADMKIKASGGVRTAEQINSMLGMVDRFGMGYAAVDKLNGVESTTPSNY